MAIVQSQGQFDPEKLDYQGLQDALSTASDALVSARRSKDMRGVVAALDIVVRCNLQLGDTFAANLAATDELAMIRRAQDKVSEANALYLVAEVRSMRGDAAGAVQALEEASQIAATFQDEKALQAKVFEKLAFAKLAIGKVAEAQSPAEDAIKLYGDLQDDEGRQRASRALNLVYVQKHQLDKAPGREEAVQALKELSDAVESRNSMAWAQNMEVLDRNGAYTSKDLEEVINGAIEKDRSGASVFLQEQGIRVQGSGDAGVLMQSVPRVVHDMGMRVGGMGYGPSFRCGRTIFRAQVPAKPDFNTFSLTCFKVSSEADDWEKDLNYHPGCLDSMLQSSGYCMPTAA